MKLADFSLKMLHGSTQSFDISFNLIQVDQNFHAQFTVIPRANYLWNMGKNLQDDPRKNWGLWNFDVVELFWQKESGIYHEWEVSPSGHALCVDILKPREIYLTPLKCDVIFSSKLSEGNVWETKVEIPSHYNDHKQIVLGAFAILGQDNQRQYYGIQSSLPANARPDFHRPQDFVIINQR